MATEHLLSLGHRRIGMICGHREAEVSLQRRDGYMLALVHAGIPYEEELVYYGDFTEAAGVLGLNTLMRKRITGVVCISDVTAIGAYRAAQTMGLAIPRDLSIVGYDDTTLTGIVNPGLTSVNQNPELIGRSAATLIRSVLHHRSVGDIVIHPSLTIRGSTAVPCGK